jgi:hypothetical protein
LLIILPLVVVTLAACRDRGTTPDEIPTRIPSVEMLATSEFMTENAPPPGFRESVAFPQIDDQLTGLPSWRYESVMQFDGVFARTPREVDASASADVWYAQLGRKRRVVVEGAGALFGQAGDTALEGVRLSDDTYLVRDHVCVATGSEQATLVADLRAGDLIGGVTHATPTGRRATINGQAVWHYAFTLDDLTLPQVQQNDDSVVTLIGGELWVAPEQNAVIRFYANLDVENVVLRLVDNTLPLTGTLILRYDLYDIGVDPNITQPFGC